MAATSTRALALVGLLSALCATGAAGVARADGPKPTPTSTQEAEAEALFQRARAKVLQGDFAAACPLFEESYRLAGGGGTAQNLATCYEDLGKLALAHKTFVTLRRASVASGREDRVRLCDEHIVKLELRLARLRVRVPPQSRVPGMKILVDGDEPDEPTRTAGVLVYPGVHVVRVSAPGRAPIELQRVVPREGAIEIVDVPVLRTSADGPPTEGPPTDKKDDRLAAREATRVVGFAVGGAGLAVLVAGGVFGVLTVTTNNAAKRACRDNTEGLTLSNTTGNDPSRYFDAAGGCYASTPERVNPFVESANQLHSEARSYGTIATLLIPVGLAAAGAGAYLVLTSSDELPRRAAARAPRPKASPVTARVVPGLGGLVVAGEFQ
jgi:hypothetical protein